VLIYRIETCENPENCAVIAKRDPLLLLRSQGDEKEGKAFGIWISDTRTEMSGLVKRGGGVQILISN